MKREILISQEANEKRVAILEDSSLEELYIERNDQVRMFGNIYKGRVKTVIPGMGASFVDLGTSKDGFLYVADALRSPMDMDVDFEDENGGGGENAQEPQPQEAQNAAPQHGRQHGHQHGHQRGQQHGHRHEKRNPRRERPRRIEEVLKVGQEVIVQVVKEGIRNKGPRLTTHFSIPARFLVMMPGESKVGISRRIEDRKERDRIRAIFKEMEVPKGAGFIVRTAAEGKAAKEFTRDIRYLIGMWKKIQASIQRKRAPSLIHQELDLVERVIRDHLTEDTDKLVVDHQELSRRVRRFVSLYLPGQNAIRVDDYHGHIPLMEKYNVEKEIARTFQKNVYLKSGGYIVIEQTEGLVAIDVNTGKFTGTRNLEETVFKTNMEAAQEVARQLRLRDVGGIVIIDFIDMERGENRRQLIRSFKEAVKRDRAKTNILQISDLGLVEMTRQRLRPSLESAMHQTCPYCEGKGMVKSPTTMAIQTIKDLRRALAQTHGRVVNAYVHATVAERLLNQEKRALQHVEHQTKSRIFIFSEPGTHIEDVNITFVK
jgi:ribonuclease G